MALVRRAWVSFAAVSAACLVLVPAAHAAFGFQGLSAAPSNPKAGAHSDLNIHIGFTQATDDVKDLTVSLPPGMVGNPTATPLCTLSQLQGDSCPAASQVGTTTANVTAHLADPLPLTLPLTVNGSVYNLQAANGEPARFGIVLRPTGSDPLPLFQKIIQVSDVRLRKTDFGLDTVLSNIPNVAHALGQAISVPTDINSIDLSLKGTVGGKDFLRNPTSCGTKTVSFSADSHANPNQKVTGKASWVSTNCAALPFAPHLSVEVGGPGATGVGKTVPMTTAITQGNGEAGLQNAQVLLPVAIGPNIRVLDNRCPLARFHANAAACPAASKVGTATASSPLLSSPLNGTVVIVDPAPGELFPGLGVDLRGQLAMQVIGSFIYTPALGNAFSNLPDIPISNFKLRFHGGNGGLVSTGVNLCKARPPLFRANFGGWNGATRSVGVKAKINGCPG
jgi:hypothetical protein